MFHLPLGSRTLHSQDQGEDIEFWNPNRFFLVLFFFFLFVSPAFPLFIDFLQCLSGEKVGDISFCLRIVVQLW